MWVAIRERLLNRIYREKGQVRFLFRVVEEIDVNQLFDLDIWGCNVLYDGREECEAWLGTVHHLQVLLELMSRRSSPMLVGQRCAEEAGKHTEMTFLSPSNTSLSCLLSNNFLICWGGNVFSAPAPRELLADCAASSVSSLAIVVVSIKSLCHMVANLCLGEVKQEKKCSYHFPASWIF